ncbi:MAG: hypothetical protein K5776_01440 [Lachnospiraceae bacterium]|nr:hypothetical protein [Lachnospiraceae bacterium]
MKLSAIYSDGMIIQRNAVNIIEGTATPNEEIRLYFDKNIYEGECDHTGHFSIRLNPMPEGGPHTINISDKSDRFIINDVYVGDVFLLAGQSNMELPVSRTLDLYKEELEGIDYPYIRKFQMPKEFRFDAPDEITESGEWISADEKAVMEFSALGFYFAQLKYDIDKVPVGLVHAAVGGTHIEAFMSEERLIKTGAKLRKKAKEEGRPLKCECMLNDSCKMCYEETIEINKNRAYVEKTIKKDLDNITNWNRKTDEDDIGLSEKWYDHEWSEEEIKGGVEIKVPESWLNNVLKNRIGTVWVQRTVYVPEEFCGRDVQLRLGTIVDADQTYVNGVLVGRTDYFYPPRRYELKAGILKPGKNVITVRVIINNNVGEFKEDMPYCIKADDEEISLEGIWIARVAAIEEPMGPQKFFTWMPTALYNKMIYPLRNITFNSVLFYQGESNTRYPEDYEYLMIDMVKEWRDLFNRDVPFLFARLPYFRGESWEIPGDDWENLRDAQQRACDKIKKSACVELYDLGEYNEIHTQNKKEVAKRFIDEYVRLMKSCERGKRT